MRGERERERERERGGGKCACVCAKLKTLALAPSPVHPFPAHRWVTVLDSDGNSVIMRSLIKELHAVALSSDGRGKMDGDHLKEGISCREPATHDCL